MRIKPQVLVLCAVPILLAAGVAWIAAPSFYYQMIAGRALESDLGFRHGSPYVQCGASFDEVLTFEKVTPGGACDRAGFREGDIIRGPSITEFFELLRANRGSEVTVRVVAGGNGPPLEARAERQIALAVPARD